MNAQQLQMRQQRLAAEQEAIAQQLDLIHHFGEDEYEDGTVIRFDKKLGSPGKSYSYAAIKSNGVWYTTGPVRGGTPRTWDELIAWLADGHPTTEIWVVTEYEEVTS